jgi:hypothetical protein
MLNLDDFQPVNGTAYRKATPQAVIEVLERARQSRRTGRPQRLRVFYGNPRNGRDALHMCAFDGLTGYVGRATGNFKTVLMVHNSRSLGGDHITDHHIVKIVDTRTKRVLYKHPRYYQPHLEVFEGCHPDYPFEVIRTPDPDDPDDLGEVLARFETAKQASRFLKFMLGERMSP